MKRFFALLFSMSTATQVAANDELDERANLIISIGEVLYFDVRNGEWGDQFVFLISYEKRIYLCDVTETSDSIDVDCLDSVDTSSRYLNIPDSSGNRSMRILRTD